MSVATPTHDLPPATSLTDEELAKYAQMRLDIKERLPIEWQQELLLRLTKTLGLQLLNWPD